MDRGAKVTAWVLVALACVVIVALSVLIGSVNISPGRVWEEWRSNQPISETPALSIVVNQRLPRTLTALIVGSGLALVGAALQALLRNPLATPYTLGIASAGAFGAWSATILTQSYGVAASFLGIPTLEAMAFGFASLDVFIVYWLAVGKGRVSPSVLLLAGVTMGMLANSGILLMRYLADPERVVMMDRWLMGGVDVLGFEPVRTLFFAVTPCMFLLFLQAPKFDQLGFGSELASGRGVNVTRLTAVTFLAGSFATAIIVSKVGPIGFVGLLVPHAVRSFTGSRHRPLMLACVVVGGPFLCACDIIARILMTGETPIGIITTLLGGPFFLYLLMRRRFTDWGA